MQYHRFSFLMVLHFSRRTFRKNESKKCSTLAPSSRLPFGVVMELDTIMARRYLSPAVQ